MPLLGRGLKPGIVSEIALATFGLAGVTIEPLGQRFQRFLRENLVGSICQFQAILGLEPQFLGSEHGLTPSKARSAPGLTPGRDAVLNSLSRTAREGLRVVGLKSASLADWETMLRTSRFPTPTITTIFAVETSRDMNHEAPAHPDAPVSPRA
jgi:hypothetical protein